MNRAKKIISLYKIATAYEDLLRSKTKEVQIALMDAGYSLPMFGADGKLGNETYDAIIRFKKDYNLALNRSLSNKEFNLLKSKNIKNPKANMVDMAPPISSDISGIGRNISERVLPPSLKNKDVDIMPAGSSTLLFGDSQMQGGIGSVLEAKFGGVRMSKPGSSASYWVNLPALNAELRKKPNKIIVQLGGNGISGTEQLLNKIKSITPNSEIIWYGSPPATLKEGSSYSAVRTETNVKNFNKTRKANNNAVANMVASSGLNARFIDPFDDIFGVNEDVAKPYVCNKCDGVHVPASVAAQKYA
jgi:peptidoglycan hydrolase-like protein with peptidoglycan-binding domain